MSDSEDEAAFQSADEGDGDQSATNTKKDVLTKEKSSVVNQQKAQESQSKDTSKQKGPKENPETKNQGGKKGKRKGKKTKQQETKTQESPVPSGTKENVFVADQTNAKVIESKPDMGDLPEGTGESNLIVDKPVCEIQVTDNVVDTEKVVDIQTQPVEEISHIMSEQNSEKNAPSSDKNSADSQGTSDYTHKKQQEECDEVASNDNAKQEQILSRLSGATGGEKQSSGWGSWGSWGSSILSTATNSVTTFTSQVGEGLHTVIEAVDSSLGAVPPEEMVKIQKVKEDDYTETDVVLDHEGHEIQKKEKSDKSSDEIQDQSVSVISKDQSAEGENSDDDNVSSTGGWFSQWGVSTLTSAVKNTVDTSKHLVEGSLDVLETIGKKTVDVLKDTDPGFEKTKKLIKGDSKPSLSELLSEAKKEAEENAKLQSEQEEAQKASFGLLFDEYQGLAHLEALEMLSNQSEAQMQTLLEALPTDVADGAKMQIDKIEEKFDIEEDENDDEEKEHDFVKLITDHLSELHLGTTPDKLNKVHCETREWLSKCFMDQACGDAKDPKELHEKALRGLAETTAKAVEQFHKAGELMLLQKDEGRDFVRRAESLASLTKVLCTEMQILSTKFSRCLNTAADDSEDPETVNPLMTDVYLEASNSSQYIMDAFKLLTPVIQQAAIETIISQSTE